MAVLVFVPVVSGAEKAAPESHTFVTNGGRSACVDASFVEERHSRGALGRE